MTYKIKQTSLLLYILTFLTTLLLGTSLLALIPKGNFLIFIICFVPIFILAFYFPKFTSVAEIEITLDEFGIKKKWNRQFIFHNKKNKNIQWAEIKEYIIQPDRQFDKFKLILQDKSKFTFYHNNDDDNKDDFRNFLSDFVYKINEFNVSTAISMPDKIKLGKTIYETYWGLITAIFTSVILVALPIFIFFAPHRDSVNTTNYAMLASSYIGGLYYVIQVYIHRKKRVEYERNFR